MSKSLILLMMKFLKTRYLVQIFVSVLYLLAVLPNLKDVVILLKSLDLYLK